VTQPLANSPNPVPASDDRVPITFERVAERLRSRVDPDLFRDVEVVVAIARGGIVPGALVAFHLGVPLRILRLRFRDDTNAPLGGRPEVVGPVPDVARKRVLIVDDVGVSGATLRAARDALRAADARTLVVKGKAGAADVVLFDDVPSCVVWPWNEDVESEVGESEVGESEAGESEAGESEAGVVGSLMVG
jgi:uncharacterized protein